jgi:hypothetical protein
VRRSGCLPLKLGLVVSRNRSEGGGGNGGRASYSDVTELCNYSFLLDSEAQSVGIEILAAR